MKQCSVLPPDTDETVSTMQSSPHTASNNDKLEKMWLMEKSKNSIQILVVSNLELALFQVGGIDDMSARGPFQSK